VDHLRGLAGPDLDELGGAQQIVVAVRLDQRVCDALEQRQLHDVEERS